ncbi:threonine synthase-like 2 [Elysia marginata]|uniref:Threonine synthase-like 2 n=1 Tax=Elysia marginata TaxID=1093978 RepID=A0AAV4FNK5_9GAST|nr:threonine synthase-like 2 [Elysia marginata]
MKYHSTRGGARGLTFKDMLLSGYACDGGMLLPETIPAISTDTLRSWAGLSYAELAFKVASCFIEESDIPAVDLQAIFEKAYSTFSVPEVVPLARLKDGLVVVELFHGRSLAFKDLSLACLGNFYNYFLTKENRHMTLLVCTSGDTGSAAIEAVRGFDKVDIIVMLPRDRITKLQELMMTTVLDSNVHVYRMDGSSDDIDVVVRDLFADVPFSQKHNLASPSSLNFTRVLVQMVHIYYTYLQLCPSADSEVEMVLPTGGGGNVTAGMLAREMGLPAKFVCAVNDNNVLSHMMDTGECKLGDVHVTLAPAMDIQFAYNLERIWYLCSKGDSSLIKKVMKEVETGTVNVPLYVLNAMKAAIKVYTVTGDEEIKTTLKRCWDENQYNLCPHSAVGVAYYYNQKKDIKIPCAVLATASPLKFPDAIEASGVPVPSSERMRELLDSPVRHIDLEKGENWTAVVKAKVEEISKLKTRVADL